MRILVFLLCFLFSFPAFGQETLQQPRNFCKQQDVMEAVAETWRDMGRSFATFTFHNYVRVGLCHVDKLTSINWEGTVVSTYLALERYEISVVKFEDEYTIKYFPVR